jgi:hypothetical protein
MVTPKNETIKMLISSLERPIRYSKKENKATRRGARFVIKETKTRGKYLIAKYPQN